MKSDETGTYRIINLNEQQVNNALFEYIEKYHDPLLVFDHKRVKVETPEGRGKFIKVITIFHEAS